MKNLVSWILIKILNAGLGADNIYYIGYRTGKKDGYSMAAKRYERQLNHYKSQVGFLSYLLGELKIKGQKE